MYYNEKLPTLFPWPDTLLRVLLEEAGQQIDDFFLAWEATLEQLFLDTAHSGLDRWEKDFGLTIFIDKPEEQRRERLLSRIRGTSGGAPTKALIKSVAESYVYGHVEIIEQPAAYRFTVKFVDPLGIPANLVDIQAAIEDIKHAHLEVAYEFTYTVWGNLPAANKKWGDLVTSGLTWEQLKTWSPT